MKPNTTQQINAYVSSQQLLHRRLQFLQAIKKADRTRQSNRSTSNNQVTNPNVQICDVQILDVTSKINHSNQLTHGVNQYATV